MTMYGLGSIIYLNRGFLNPTLIHYGLAMPNIYVASCVNDVDVNRLRPSGFRLGKSSRGMIFRSIILLPECEYHKVRDYVDYEPIRKEKQAQLEKILAGVQSKELDPIQATQDARKIAQEGFEQLMTGEIYSHFQDHRIPVIIRDGLDCDQTLYNVRLVYDANLQNFRVRDFDLDPELKKNPAEGSLFRRYHKFLPHLNPKVKLPTKFRLI